MPMARDLGKYNIRVVGIQAGTFDTPMLGFLPEKSKKNILS